MGFVAGTLALALWAQAPDDRVRVTETGEEREFPVCTRKGLFSRRIVWSAEIVEFSIPWRAKVQRMTDDDYYIDYVRYRTGGQEYSLRMMTGPLAGGETPIELGDTSIIWTKSKWSCKYASGSDWKGVSADGRRWRHRGIPFGSASYRGAPEKAAKYFDKILESMCCPKCEACKQAAGR